MKSLSLSIVALSLGLVAGCGSSGGSSASANQAPAAPKLPTVELTASNQREIFPFKEGNSWVFTVEAEQAAAGQQARSSNAEMEYRVTKVWEDGGLTHATLSIFQNGQKKDEQEWAVDDKGLYQISVHATKKAFSPKLMEVKFPVKDQEDFKYSGTGLTPIGKMGKLTYAFKNDGIMAADTDMGAAKSIFIESVGTFEADGGAKGRIAVNQWFAPGIGLVRLKQIVILGQASTSVTLRLKSYNVKK